VVTKVENETGSEMGFKGRLERDQRNRERFFVDLYMTDFSNWMGMRDTERIEREGYILYIADGYMVNVFLEYTGKKVVVDENALYYVLITKFLNGYKVMIYQYANDVLVELNDPLYSIFIRRIADINSVISIAYHNSVVLSHTFRDITEYYTDIISNIK